MTENAIDRLLARVAVRDQSDVAVARKQARALALQLGLADPAAAALATATSELARNIVIHATAGELLFGVGAAAGRPALVVLVHDDGPGIVDLERALLDGYSSTPDGLGLGLSSARRLVDDFAILSVVGEGTTVILRMWIGYPKGA